MSRIDYVPKRPAPGARQTSGDSSRIAMSTWVAKVNSHLNVSNVNKVASFYGIVLIMCVVPFDVHFHYIDNAFMRSVTAAQNK